MKPLPTLICIPDISGFTKFMSNTDIELSAKVIPSLLNKIIYSNEIGLKVSEIEGDAILFYKTGELPDFEDLVDQCKHFYREFYEQLEVLKKKYGHIKSVASIPKTLGLKMVVHYGDQISTIPIGKHIKLMGEDVIIAHRLLKNEIKNDEYILFSSNLLDQYKDKVIDKSLTWSQLHERDENYKHIGEVNYSYIVLDSLVK